MRFAYWAVNPITKEECNFISDEFYEIGSFVEHKQFGLVVISDLAVEEDISCEELALQRESEAWYA